MEEGVIKYALWFLSTPPFSADDVREVNAWRQVLYRLGFIGQDPDRYGGYGYGNISRRMAPFEAPPYERCFVISATQTGGLPVLTGAHYALVRACYPDENVVIAEGPRLPSSESLTHATLYALDDTLRFVMHVHAPVLWRHAQALGLPVTLENVPYGSPAMADEVRRLFAETDVHARRLFAMGGHEDGLVSFGRTAGEAGRVLVDALAAAYQR